jgi:hypothetical protein
LANDRHREEEWDRITYEALWELATKHPESGVEKIGCIECYGQSLEEVGWIRKGEKEIWIKEFTHDVESLN